MRSVEHGKIAFLGVCCGVLYKSVGAMGGYAAFVCNNGRPNQADVSKSQYNKINQTTQFERRITIMDGTLRITLKNGESKLISNVTAFDLFKMDINGGKEYYKINAKDTPMIIYKKDEVDRLMMW
jgi:hypothetical protein